MRFFSIILVFLMSFLTGKGQSYDTDRVAMNLFNQLKIFPQEKVYLMTDKAAYVAGEYIWFRAFLTDAVFHREGASMSRYIYVDLIDPNGNILKHYMIRPDSNNVFHNRIELDDDMAEGTYLIRAYTTFMRSRAEYLFEKKLFIADPLSPFIAIEPQFSFNRDRQASVFFRFRNLKDSSFLSIESIKIKTDNAELQEFPAKRNINLRVNPQNDKYLYVTFTHGARQYRKFIAIPYPTETPFDVSFFPEGGSLLAGVPSKIGFKALRSDGLSDVVAGDVYDSDDQYITSFQSFHAGMGSFFFSPQADKTYYALCTVKDTAIRFELPPVETNGCALQVISRNGQYVITANDYRSHKDSLFLIVHIRGMVFFADVMPQNNRISLLITDLPPGIIQVLLLDKEMNPLSERLIFNRQADFGQVELLPNQADFGRRALVKMNIRFKVPDGYENNGSFAVSVTDDRDILPDSTMTLSSYLLLSSELRGYIEDAGFYLNNDNNAIAAIDALMLTQGWRRYDIPAVVKGVLEEPDSYIEVGQEFSGSVKLDGLGGKFLPNASVWVIAPDMQFMQEGKTDHTGIFNISGFEFPDSTRYVIQAFAPKNKITTLTLDPELPLLPAKNVLERLTVKDSKFRDYVAKADQKFIDEHGMRSYEIPEVVVTAKKAEEERSVYAAKGIVDKFIRQEDVERWDNDLAMLLKHAPGIFLQTIRDSIGIRKVAYIPPFRKHPAPALIVLDDVVMPDIDIDELSGILIKSVEIMSAPLSYQFGSIRGLGTGGALLITTYREWGGAKPLPTPHIAKITPLGYKKAAQFYSPKYDNNAQINSSKPDLRTTIFWKPDVQIIDGEAYIEFYTADTANTTYSVVLEGITKEGVIRQTGKIIRNRE